MTTIVIRTEGDPAFDVVRRRRRWHGGRDAAEGPSALVWIDSRDATIVRDRDGRYPVEHVTSEVPGHHRSTGHVRHDPALRHGGGGPDQHAGEPHRAEHLGRFLADVARRLEGEQDVVVVGPGEVRGHLARLLRGPAGFGSPDVLVHTEPASRMSDRQLVALLRELTGRAPRRGRRSRNEPSASWEPDQDRVRGSWRRDRRRRIAEVLEPSADR